MTKGNYNPIVSNIKVMLDPNIPEAVFDEDVQARSIEVTHLLPLESFVCVTDFENETIEKNIIDSKASMTECHCIFVATIKEIYKNLQWFYLGCKECHKKVVPASEVAVANFDGGGYAEVNKNNIPSSTKGRWWRSKCLVHTSSITPRFKLKFHCSMVMTLYL